MTNRNSLFAALVAAFASASACPAIAADGAILITHAKALAGNITPGDAPGYPITINGTGSYKLGGNLIPGTGKIGIQITADFVTIDMSGFTLRGGDKAEKGIGGNGNGARIENGSVVNFKGDGINGTGESWTIENMVVTGNGGMGIRSGDLARVLNSNISKNGSIGVVCAGICHVEGNLISRNGSDGAWINGGMALGNTFEWNKGAGIRILFYAGFGNNTLINNNQPNGPQGYGLTQGKLHPNYCNPDSCP